MILTEDKRRDLSDAFMGQCVARDPVLGRVLSTYSATVNSEGLRMEVGVESRTDVQGLLPVAFDYKGDRIEIDYTVNITQE